MRHVWRLAIVLVVLGALLGAASGPLAGAVADDPVSRHWVLRAPWVLFGTAALLLASARVGFALVEVRAQAGAEGGVGEGLARMALLSACGLLLELALIRWVGAEVRAFAYFKNFVLIGAFVGFGVGFALGPRPTRLLPLTFVGAALLVGLVALWNDASIYPGIDGQEQTWGHVVQADQPAKVAFMLAFFLLSLVSFFAALVLSFVGLAQEMGALFVALPRVPAYAANLAGSLAGVLVFNALCWAETPPGPWFAAGLAPLVWLLDARRARLAGGAALALVVVGATVIDQRPTGFEVLHRWSPYYRVGAGPYSMPLPGGRPSAARHAATVNRELMTYAAVMDPRLYAGLYGQEMPLSTYELPYLLHGRPRRVLVLAAGMGNDVAAALRHDPEKVTAVELDPAIAGFARLLRPERALDDPRVELVIDDARHHVETTGERYDLVLMSFLDSHTLIGAYTQLRTDNYLYTRECFERIRGLLAPDGVFVCTYATDRLWLVHRLIAALRAAFGEDPVIGGDGYAFCAVGPGVARGLAGAPAVREWLAQRPMAQPPADQRYPTDDRPFLTLADDALPTTYWIANAVVALLALGTLRVVGLPVRGLDPRFALLGAAFLLAETRLITIAGRLFGVTWHAYGVAISLVLVALVLGTLAVGRLRPRQLWPVYVLVVLAVLASQLVSNDALARLDGGVRLLAAVAVHGPLFLLASFLFTSELERTPAEGVPNVLAANLLGSVVGGLLEYQAVSFGVASLTITAAVLYAAAALCPRRA